VAAGARVERAARHRDRQRPTTDTIRRIDILLTHPIYTRPCAHSGNGPHLGFVHPPRIVISRSLPRPSTKFPAPGHRADCHARVVRGRFNFPDSSHEVIHAGRACSFRWSSPQPPRSPRRRAPRRADTLFRRQCGDLPPRAGRARNRDRAPSIGPASVRKKSRRPAVPGSPRDSDA